MANMHLKHTLLEVVENQLRENDPPITKATFDRLTEAGYSKSQAKEKIAAVLVGEIYDVMKQKEPFDEARFSQELNKLN